MRPALHLAVVLVPLVLAATPGSATGQDVSSLAPPGGFDDQARVAKLRTAIPRIDSVFRAAAARSHAPGFAYGIIVDGALIHVGVGGIREVPSRAPVDTNTVFRIASMSKSFAAASILQLRDEGKLRLDDPAERYVPELASLRYPTDDSRRITVRDLLTHSAGFPEDNPWGDRQLAISDDELSAMLRGGIPFSTAPGTAYEYSNYGFAILGRIVANVSGMSYSQYLTERVLRPLGMTSTTLEVATVPAARLAHGYRWQDEAWLDEPQLADGAFGPMGGMLTSISDLARWVGLMLDAWPPRSGGDAGPLRRASLREMQQVQRYSGAVAVRVGTDSVALSAGGYGFGLSVRQACTETNVSHSGGLPGFGSLMRWLPEHGVGVVALGNVTYMGWSAATERALALLRETGALVPRAPQPSPVLLTRTDQVTRLVTAWNDALADSIAAMNLYPDEAKDRRRAAIARLVSDAGGDCRRDGQMVAENALRGRWRMRCASGDLRVDITLAPTEPARVQWLNVRPMRREESLAAPPACR